LFPSPDSGREPGAANIILDHLARILADRVLLIDEPRTVAIGAPLGVLRSDTLSWVYDIRSI